MSEQKFANMADYLEGTLHREFTVIADGLLIDGRVTREERIALSGCVGSALDAFHNAMQEKCPQLSQRDPWSQALMPNAEMPAMMSVPAYVKSLHLPHDEQFMRDVLAVKFIGKDDIKGYTVLWGNEDLVDLETEFFTPQTDFWHKALGVPRPLTWNHAQDRDIFKAHPVIGKMLEFGNDDVGMFYNAVLERAHQYRAAIDKHIAQRNIGTSSDSAPQYVERVKTKKGATWLKTWPLLAAALTDVPCEPRMIEQGNVYWKSVGVDLSAMSKQSAEAAQAAARAELEQRITNAQRQHQLLNFYTEG